MLNATESLALLERTHPCLERTRAVLVDEWNPDDVPPTIVSSSMATALISVADGLTEQELSAVATCIEEILVVGDQTAQDVIATGFLEAVVAGEDESREGAFRLMASLGPKAIAYCQKWKAFTNSMSPE